MALDNQLGRWTQRVTDTLTLLEQIAEVWPRGTQPVTPSTLRELQRQIGELLGTGNPDMPQDPALAEVIKPLVTVRDDFLALREVPGGGAGLHEWIARICTVSKTTHTRLVADEQLRTQSADQVIEEFSEEYRMSLILNITANYALSQRVARWQDSKGSAPVGSHLDLLSLEFTDEKSVCTIPMDSLTAASTGAPVVATPHNLGSAMREMKTGGAPPPIYRMAYSQWFTTIAASWEDVYRPRLAAAYSDAENGKTWTKNDIRSEFFYEVQQIRNDFAHHWGICVDSSDNKLFEWLEPGKLIAPNPRQMLNLLNRFPEDELRQPPEPRESVQRKVKQLPYSFDAQWVEKLQAHAIEVSPSRAKRSRVIQQVLDKWMKR